MSSRAFSMICFWPVRWTPRTPVAANSPRITSSIFVTSTSYISAAVKPRMLPIFVSMVERALWRSELPSAGTPESAGSASATSACAGSSRLFIWVRSVSIRESSQLGSGRSSQGSSTSRTLVRQFFIMSM